MELFKFRANHYYNYNPENVDIEWASTIFNAIIDCFEKNTSIKFELPPVLVYERTDHPMCSFCKNTYCIGLCIKNNDLLNLTFQFAHEYCHRIIGGKMTRDYSGLKWVEESLCETSSIYFINYISCIHKQFPKPFPMIQPFRTLYDYWTRQGLELSHQMPLYLQTLSEPIEHRILYQNIASIIVHHFVSNPNLWKILLHIGDSCQWQSLDELFDHLQQNADDNYRDSLIDLKNTFLP